MKLNLNSPIVSELLIKIPQISQVSVLNAFHSSLPGKVNQITYD